MPFISTILCVDDDEDDLFFIREVIGSQPYAFTIEEAHNGWEAMKFLDQAIATEKLPCLVIMDMNMPRMDGRQTIKRSGIRENCRKCPSWFLPRLPMRQIKIILKARVCISLQNLSIIRYLPGRSSIFWPFAPIWMADLP
jgi:CheY-like chemotaxis protein